MAFCLGFYDGFLGPGTAAFLMFCLIKIFKLDFSSASGNTKILNLSSNFASLLVFTILGKSNFLYGVPIAIIMSFGAILGAKLAILKGNKFLIYVKCELLAKINIADKIAQLQNLIKRDLGENIGVEVNKVVVNISKLEVREGVRETETFKETSDIPNDENIEDVEVSD